MSSIVAWGSSNYSSFDEDYLAFERVIVEALKKREMRILKT